MKKAWVLSYPLSAQQRLWSDWVDAQADLSLRWVHMPLCWFCHEAAQMSRSLHTCTLCVENMLWMYVPNTDLCTLSCEKWTYMLESVFLEVPVQFCFTMKNSPSFSNQKDRFLVFHGFTNQNSKSSYALGPNNVMKALCWLAENILQQALGCHGCRLAQCEKFIWVHFTFEVFLNNFLNNCCLLWFSHSASQQHIA